MFTLDIQKNVQNFLNNFPKWPKFENGLKLEYARKSQFFDRKTSYIYDRLILD